MVLSRTFVDSFDKRNLSYDKGTPGTAWAEGKASTGADEPFFFIQMADPQLFWGSRELWKTAIGHGNRLRPAFVAVCGDLLNRNGNSEAVDLDKDEERAKAYLEVTAKLDRRIPLYNVAGNHDVCNTSTKETFQWYRKRFGRLWYTTTHGNCLFIVLQSDVLKSPKGAPGQAAEQIKWLGETLDAARTRQCRHRIVFMHHPMCLKSVDEKGAYFNMPEALRKQLVDLFHKHAVRAVFSGHYHRNRYVKDGQLELVTSASTGKALGKDPLGLRIVKVHPNRIEHKYYSYADLPARVELQTDAEQFGVPRRSLFPGRRHDIKRPTPIERRPPVDAARPVLSHASATPPRSTCFDSWATLPPQAPVVTCSIHKSGYPDSNRGS